MQIAINGFGRIGRTFFRAAHRRKLDIVAINDLGNLETLAHLLKYDSTYGHFDGKVSIAKGNLVVDGKVIKVFSEKDPSKLPWKNLGVELVVESTGVFTDHESALAHIKAGAKNVVISAPAKDKKDAQEKVKTIVLGVNEDEFDVNEDVLSMASCTTNCLAPVADVLHKNYKILKSSMSTIHSYTMDQRLQDDAHKDLRRARAASQSIIPTTTGATEAVVEVIPDLAGKMNGLSYRVPTATVSLVDFVALVGKKTNVEEVNVAFEKAADDSSYLGSLAVSREPLVSIDFRGDPHGATVDLLSTQVIDGNLVRVVAWYDNEMGYSERLAAFCQFVEQKMNK
jgi:glyceraldehyde-3-phosphate dehydrogenase type I